MTGHACVDHDASSLVLAVDPEFGGSTGGVEDSEDIRAINIVEVFLVQLDGRFDDRDASILQVSTR